MGISQNGEILQEEIFTFCKIIIYSTKFSKLGYIFKEISQEWTFINFNQKQEDAKLSSVKISTCKCNQVTKNLTLVLLPNCLLLCSALQRLAASVLSK